MLSAKVSYSGIDSAIQVQTQRSQRYSTSISICDMLYLESDCKLLYSSSDVSRIYAKIARYQTAPRSFGPNYHGLESYQWFGRWR
jgi:hypothetical protein